MLNCNGAFLNLTERTERRIFMKKLLYFMKDYKKESVLAPLFKMLEAFFELFVPLVVASIIDDGIILKNQSHIIKMCLLLLYWRQLALPVQLRHSILQLSRQ